MRHSVYVRVHIAVFFFSDLYVLCDKESDNCATYLQDGEISRCVPHGMATVKISESSEHEERIQRVDYVFLIVRLKTNFFPQIIP